MAVRRLRAAGGLSTDPSALDQPESLRLADDVLLHRPGYVQPRMGFGDTTGVTARTTTRRPIALYPYDGDVVVQSLAGAVYTLERLGSATTYGTVAPPAPDVRGVSSFAVSRGSLLVTSSTGVRALEAKTETATRRAGSVTRYQTLGTFGYLLATANRHAIGPESAVSYRYCWVHIDPNGYRQRSAPSSRRVVANGDTTRHADVIFGRIYLPDGIVAGDRFELYRSTNVTPETSDPGDELFLAVDYEITADEVTNGYIGTGYGYRFTDTAIVDRTPDSQLGASLYTNASQQGILASNEQPPLAVHLAEWSSRMWYGHTTERPALSIEVKSVFDINDAETWRDGAHYSSKIGNFSNGQGKITSVNSVAGLKVGQYVSVSGQPRVGLTPLDTTLVKITAIQTVITVVDNSTITALPTMPADSIEFTGIAKPLLGSLTGWEKRTFGTLTGEIPVGATAEDTCDNIIAALPDGLSGVRGGSAVTITDDRGYAVPIVLTQDTPGTFAVSYTVEIDKNATASDTAVTFYAHDYIVINGAEFYFSDISTTIANDWLYQLVFGVSTIEWCSIKLDNVRASGETPLDQCRRLVAEIQTVVNDYDWIGASPTGVDIIADDVIAEPRSWYLGQGFNGPTAFLIVRQQPTGGVTFSAPVRPEAFLPQANTVTEALRPRPSRLWWSKPDEPVAVPPINFVDVGQPGAAILALVPLDDALLVFKEDGIYSVTGAEPWVVDELSTTHRLVAPQAVCVLDGQCFAWTDRGVVVVNAGGLGGVISGPIATTLREYQRNLTLGETGEKTGFWMIAHKRLGLVMLGVAESSASTQTAEQFVFHAATQRWSRWARADRCMTYDPAGDRLIVSPGVDAWSVLRERSDEDSAASYHDASLSGVSGSLDDSTTLRAAITAFAPWTPAAGDVVRVALGDVAAWRRVTAVATDGSDYVLTLDGIALSVSGFEWRQSYQTAIEWQAQHLPGLGSRWEELHLALGTSSSGYTSTWPMDVGARVGETGLTAVVTPTITPGGTSQVVRVGPSREMVRAYHCYPRLAVRHAGALWLASEMALHVSPQSRRVRR